MNQNPSSLWKDTRRWLPGVLVSLVAFILLFKFVRWQEFLKALTLINPWMIVISSVLTIGFLFSRAMAWRTLLENKVEVLQTFWAINVGYLLNNLFPLRAGEFGRAFLLGQTSGLGMVHVLSTIIIERAFDLAMAAVLLLSTLPLALQMDWARPVALVTLVLVLAGLTALYLMARFNDVVHTWSARLGTKWGFFERSVLPQVDGLLRGLRVLVNPWRFLGSLFWIALSWLIGVLVYYVVALSLVPTAPVWWGAFLDSVLAMGIAIPSAPAALGVFEASLVAALKILGIAESSGLAYAVVMHFLQFLITGLLGLMGLAREGKSIFSFFSDLRLKRQPTS